MIPDINIFGRTFSAYTFFALAGALAAVFFVYLFSRKKGYDEFTSLYMILICFIGVVFGGHIFYGLTNFNLIVDLIRNPGKITSFNVFIDSVKTIFGGSVFYGGLTGALLCAWLYLRNKNVDRKAYIDIAVFAIPLFHFFGRLGCFFSGCCYGIKSTFGVTYNYSHAPGANGVTRFPVQLVEALVNVAIFIALLLLYKAGKCRGKLLCVYLISYSCARFLLEFLRGDEIRGHIGILSTSQIISIVYFVLAVMYLLAEHIKNKGKSLKKL